MDESKKKCVSTQHPIVFLFQRRRKSLHNYTSWIMVGYVGGGAVCLNSGLPGYHRWNPTTYPLLAMEVDDLPPGYRFNPSDNLLIDGFLEPMVKGKLPAHCGKAVQHVENFYSSCPSELDGSRDLLENKENSLHLFVRRNRMNKHGNKVSRAAKGGSWRARNKSEEIMTHTGVKAKKGVYEYTPRQKSEPCAVKWILEEYVLDRGEQFEDYALCKLRVIHTKKRRQEERASGKKKQHADADNAAGKNNSSRQVKGTKTNPPLQIQTNPPLPTQINPPLPIMSCSQESDMELWSVLLEKSMYDDGWL